MEFIILSVTLILCLLGRETSQIKCHLLSRYLTAIFQPFLTSYSDNQKENWSIFLTSGFEIRSFFSVHPSFHGLLSLLSLKDQLQAYFFCKVSPWLIPVRSSDFNYFRFSYLSDARERESGTFNFCFYYVPNTLLKL